MTELKKELIKILENSPRTGERLAADQILALFPKPMGEKQSKQFICPHCGVTQLPHKKDCYSVFYSLNHKGGEMIKSCLTCQHYEFYKFVREGSHTYLDYVSCYTCKRNVNLIDKYMKKVSGIKTTEFKKELDYVIKQDEEILKSLAHDFCQAPKGNHHPYCSFTYIKSKKEHTDWRCECSMLEDYDKWRKRIK